MKMAGRLILVSALLLGACSGDGGSKVADESSSTTGQSQDSRFPEIEALVTGREDVPTVRFLEEALDQLCERDRSQVLVVREIRKDLDDRYGIDGPLAIDITASLSSLTRNECPVAATTTRPRSTTTSTIAPRSTTTSSPTTTMSRASVWPEADVARIVDGDTVDLVDGRRIRLAIVDTPEVHGRVDACGPEASQFTSDFLRNERVAIRRPGAPYNDSYGRVLAEVIRVRDGGSLNEALLGAGLGRIVDRYVDEDPDLAGRLRAIRPQTPACAPPPTSSPPTSAPAPTTTAAASSRGDRFVHPKYAEAARAGACDASYPTVCIPTISYWGRDIDCPDTDGQSSERGDLPQDPHFRAFKIDGPDPHNLRSPQGTGCANW